MSSNIEDESYDGSAFDDAEFGDAGSDGTGSVGTRDGYAATRNHGVTLTRDRARSAAYECILTVTRDDAYANLVMPSILRDAGLSGRDAAFATELAYGTLRMQGLYDEVIAVASKRAPAELDVDVRAALWMGTHQVLAMRVPPHAAVSETVAQVKAQSNVGAAKFANAVMRRVTEREPEAWLDLVAPGTKLPSLGKRYSHPAWIVDALAASLQADGRGHELEDLLSVNNTPARVTLVARPGLADPYDVADSIGDADVTELSPYGVALNGGDPGAISGVLDGTVAVQDEGSQVVATAMVAAQDVAEGERWLDMCSGPGGKTALLGALADEYGATVDALELHKHRAKLVRQSTRALPHGVVDVHVGDGRTWGADGSYDRVLLDAPCTGLGALRRRPESRWRRSPGDLAELAELQSQLLASAVRLVRPGGVIAYVTCSPVLAETREVVDAVLVHAGLEQVDARDAVAAVTAREPHEWGAGPHVQMWTHAHGTDAMFLALLRKPRG
ncbi:RsmB/NOP family class I SAM-dependent RNA methyltransferase [Demequina oxidasica]|uniref:RsmB/NOP family class I SAM-dependent RNA methyltransferase n=1 Tax=Demequina oxidasica TaxID=676199 RepID=UPI000A07311B|nr:RsmB/NOP family class I SAM-dependent RNA methyltransferase [Demequina oxidasica]